jgi:hypothetical protein
VTPEIARIRGIPEGHGFDQPEPPPDIANVNELLDMPVRVRDVTGKPVGIKTAIGGWQFMNDLCEAVLRRGPRRSRRISSPSMAARAVRGRAAGAGRSHGPVDRGSAAARGRCADRVWACASGSA